MVAQPEQKPPTTSSVVSVGRLLNDGVMLQSLRRLLLRLDVNTKKERGSSLLIASAESGEGKTFLTTGLGLVATREFGLSCVLVDLNWAAPRLHEIFDLPLSFGLSELFQKGATAAVRPTGINGLSVLTAPRGAESDGPKTWTGLWQAGGAPVATKELGRVFEDLTKSFDLVLVDGPAIFAKTPSPADPILVATLVQSTVLTVLMRETPRDLVKRAVLALEDSGVPVRGTIMNNRENPLYA
jgi:Mrp family chromosome partitioning ATPase